jgi:hypothetical protein
MDDGGRTKDDESTYNVGYAVTEALKGSAMTTGRQIRLTSLANCAG